MSGVGGGAAVLPVVGLPVVGLTSAPEEVDVEVLPEELPGSVIVIEPHAVRPTTRNAESAAKLARIVPPPG